MKVVGKEEAPQTSTQDEMANAEAHAAMMEIKNIKIQLLSFGMEMTRGFSNSVEELIENSTMLAHYLEELN